MGTLLVGIILTVGLSSFFIVRFSKNTADNSSEVMLTEELLSLDRLARDKSSLIEEYLGQIASEFKFLSSFATDLFNNRMKVTKLNSFYGDNRVDSNTPSDYPKYEQKNDRQVSYEASAWYSPQINPDGNSPLRVIGESEMDLIDKSSNLDIAFRTLYSANSAYTNLYIGFDSNGLFRIYPYKSLSHYPTLSYEHARTGRPMKGYDPRARQWYSDAVKISKFVFSKPYTDASGLGLMVSAAVPIKTDKGLLVGVIAADLTIKTIQNSILGQQVLNDGYVYLIDSNRNAIIHSKIDRSKPAQNIIDLEFPSDKRKEIEEFKPILANMTSGKTGSGSLFKEGKKWYVSYSAVPSAGFSLAVVVPEADILAPSMMIKTQILNALDKQLYTFLIIICLAAGGIFLFINYTAKQVVKPVQELAEVTRQIASGNLTQDLQGGVGGSKEISLLYKTFNGLITALRFGNDEYYAGNIDLAMKNYLSALELFETLGIKKGVGICHNNIGNIHRARGNNHEAEKSYNLAIRIANELLDESDDKSRNEYIYALASRLNNLALLYKSLGDFDRAERLIGKALECDRSINNTRGIASRCGNLGLVYVEQKRLEEAGKLIQESYSMALKSKSDRSKAYATMNFGIYERAVNNYDASVSRFLEAAELAEGIDLQVVLSSLKNVEEIYIEQGKEELADQVAKRLNLDSSRPKEITFVLDYSGSMQGNRIKAAVKGMLNIFENQINDNDLVSVITFNNKIKTVLPPTIKGKNEDHIRSVFSILDDPRHTTALYDAIGSGLQKYIDNPSRYNCWLICLTDGDNNASWQFTAEKVIDLAKKSAGVYLVIIGVDKLKSGPLLEDMCNATDRGKFIDFTDSADVSEAITTAFREVESMLTEVQVEGFVSEY